MTCRSALRFWPVALLLLAACGSDAEERGRQIAARSCSCTGALVEKVEREHPEIIEGIKDTELVQRIAEDTALFRAISDSGNAVVACAEELVHQLEEAIALYERDVDAGEALANGYTVVSVACAKDRPAGFDHNALGEYMAAQERNGTSRFESLKLAVQAVKLELSGRSQ